VWENLGSHLTTCVGKLRITSNNLSPPIHCILFFLWRSKLLFPQITNMFQVSMESNVIIHLYWSTFKFSYCQTLCSFILYFTTRSIHTLGLDYYLSTVRTSPFLYRVLHIHVESPVFTLNFLKLSPNYVTRNDDTTSFCYKSLITILVVMMMRRRGWTVMIWNIQRMLLTI
jgi:hypothetical protein